MKASKNAEIVAASKFAAKPATKPAAKPVTKTTRKRLPPPPSKPYHHGNLRESLLEAADEVLTTHGAAGITLREVAKAAGVSHAAPYHHFASLDDLLATVAERGFERLSAALAPTREVVDCRERLMQISEIYVNCARAQPSQFRLMFGPLLSRKHQFPKLQKAAEQSFGIVVEAATTLDKERGLELALLGWSLCHGLSNLLIDGVFDGMPMQLPDAATLARQLTQRALDGGG